MTVAYTETETGSGYVVCKHVYKPASSILAASLNHVVESLVLGTAKIWMNSMCWYHIFKSPTIETHYNCSMEIHVRMHNIRKHIVQELPGSLFPFFVNSRLPFSMLTNDSGFWTEQCKEKLSPSSTEKSYIGSITSTNLGITEIILLFILQILKKKTRRKKYHRTYLLLIKPRSCD